MTVRFLQSENRCLPQLIGTVSVLDGERVLASAGIFQNPAITYRRAPTLIFGSLSEPYPGDEAAMLLMSGMEGIARSLKFPYLLGPMNGNTWQQYRLPLEGSIPYFSGDVSSDAAWVKPLLGMGFSQCDSYMSSVMSLPHAEPAKIPGVIIRPLTADKFEADLEILYPLCLSAFEENAYFSPIDYNAFLALYKPFSALSAAGLSFIATQDDVAIGFMLAYPDSLPPDRIVLKTAARHPRHRISGLVSAIRDNVYKAALTAGYTHVIHALMHGHNRSRELSEMSGSRVLRQYALLSKKIEA